MRFAAKGALSNRGYAGKTQVGVMVWTGKILVMTVSRPGQKSIYT